MHAIKQHNLALATSLLASGAAINTRDSSGWPALHYAISMFADLSPAPLASHASRRIVALLVDRGADLEACNSCGLNAARLAATNQGCLPLVAYLVARGAGIGGVDEEGGGIEMRDGDVGVVEWLAGLSRGDGRRALVVERFERGGDEGFAEFLVALMG